MKVLAIVLALSTAAWAETVKTCRTTIADPASGRPVNILLEILRVDGALVGQITEKGEDALSEAVSLQDYTVRAGLRPQSRDDIETPPSDYNMGEQLIVHAMRVEQEPLFEGAYRSGINLALVRSVRVYGIGESEDGQPQMGQPAIIEAKDARGRVLGSFVGGFLVGTCQ
jgi:hypothetical protein